MLLENEGEILAMTEMETYSGQSPIIVNNDDKVISLDISALSAQLSGFDTFTGVSADSTLTGDGKTSALGVNMYMLTGMLDTAKNEAVASAQSGLVRDITFEMQNIGVFGDTRSSTNPDGTKNLYYHWTVERADCSGDGLTSNLDTSYNTNYISLNTSAKEALNCVVTNSSVWNNASAGNIEVNTVVENNSATWNEVTNKLDISSFSTVSGDFYPYSNPSGFITGVDLSNYYTKNETSGADELANAFSSIPTGDIEVNNLVHNNSATWNDVTNKLDTTAFSDVSGTFLTAHQSLDDYATKNYVQTNSAEITAMIPTDYYPNTNPSGFITGVDLTPYQTTAGMTAYATTGDISATEWNSVYETVETNSGSWTSPEIESYDLSAGDNIQINKDDVNSAIGIAVTGLSEFQTTGAMTGYATTGDLYNTSSTLSAAIDYVSANAGFTYTGISPIVVNNTTQQISADTWQLSAGTNITLVDDAENNITRIDAVGGGYTPNYHYIEI